MIPTKQNFLESLHYVEVESGTLAINWKNFAQVAFQLKMAFRIRS